MTFSSHAELCIVIINYRTPDMVADCLASLFEQLQKNWAVVVVDNKSEDGSVEILKKWLKQYDTNNRVRLVASETNSGFSAGNNIGIREVEADNYLLLNSDTIVRSGAIAELMKCAAEHPEAGLVSPRLEWPDGRAQKSCFRYPTPISEFIVAAETGPITKLFKNHVIALEVSDDLVRPEWTSFACVLIKAEVLEKAGLLDEGFFMYFEDIEFCHRAKLAGWQIVHVPTAHIVHLRGGSSPVKSRAHENKRLPRYFYASRTRFYFLLYGRVGLTLANTLWLCGAAIRKLRDLFGKRARSLPEKKWLDIWTDWSQPGDSGDQIITRKFMATDK